MKSWKPQKTTSGGALVMLMPLPGASLGLVSHVGLQGQGLVCVLDAAVVIHSVAPAAHDPLGSEQALHPHRAPGVDARGGDAHLCSQAKAVTIGKARGGVVEHAGAVHAPQELLCQRLVLCKCSGETTVADRQAVGGSCCTCSAPSVLRTQCILQWAGPQSQAGTTT